jgi:hypothetical protein
MAATWDQKREFSALEKQKRMERERAIERGIDGIWTSD